MTARPFDPSSPRELPAAIAVDPGAPGFAAGVPGPTGTVVLLLSGAADERWAADVAIELATEWAGQGRRIVLADLHLEDPLLHEGLGVRNMEGVVDIFLYGASLARIARPVRGGAFYLISAGTYAPDLAEVYRHQRWKKLVAGFRETDAALLLFAPAQTADLTALAGLSHEAILLAPPGLEFTDQLRDLGIEVLARLEPPALALDSDTGRGEGDTGGVAVVEIAPAAAGVTAPVTVVEEEPALGSNPPDEAVVRSPETGDLVSHSSDPKLAAAPPRSSAPNRQRSVDPGLELPPPPVRRQPERSGISLFLWILFAVILLGIAGYLVAMLRPDLLPGGPPAEATGATLGSDLGNAASRLGEMLPYSVQVTAFTSLAAANEELATELPSVGSTTFFVSPEEIQGVVYYRILAGLAPDTITATRLRDHLIETGAIEAEDAPGSWSLLQFTPLAFDLGEYATRAEADLRADSLLIHEVPAYVVTVPYSDGSSRWQLYGGAYRDSVSASSMRGLLEMAGIQARLTARTGQPSVLAE